MSLQGSAHISWAHNSSRDHRHSCSQLLDGQEKPPYAYEPDVPKGSFFRYAWMNLLLHLKSWSQGGDAIPAKAG